MAKDKHGHFGVLRTEYLPIPEQSWWEWFHPLRTFLSRRQRLLEDLVFYRPDGSEYRVEAGMDSDGPSFPLVFSPFLPSRQRVMESGFYHDDLCRKGFDLAWCDGEFRLALKAQGLSPFYAYVCYLALRVAAPWREQGTTTYSWTNVAKWVARYLGWRIR